nr:MAG TPA: hypothetical protein [Caudoviricetes sp.]
MYRHKPFPLEGMEVVRHILIFAMVNYVFQLS